MQVPFHSSGAGVSGPVSQLPHPGLCIRLHRGTGVFSALGAGASSFVMPPFFSCNLWPQVLSLNTQLCQSG